MTLPRSPRRSRWCAAVLATVVAIWPLRVASADHGIRGDGAALAAISRLGENTRAISHMSFRHVLRVVYRSNTTAFEREQYRINLVDYDRASQEIRVEYLAPYSRVEDYGAEGALPAPPTKDVFTGFTLWALNPELQVANWRLTLGASPSNGMVIVIGRAPADQIPASGYAPHWEAMVDQVRNRLISVTHFADSGEIERTIGLESYQSFANGRAVLPLRVRGREFARLNRLETIDDFSEMLVQTGVVGKKR